MYAIYARQSVDRADSISIESQIEFCKYELRGKPYKLFIDKGYSGKNTDRPQFQEMLKEIIGGTITKVVVYKLDRISRSILDFSKMMEEFQKYDVEFISSTEKFDTSTPMGRAMLNICIVFAQLERETIQKRVADAYCSRSKKGFYMGGRVPYGFAIEKTVMDGVRTSKYIIESEEAEHIKRIYNMYANPQISYGDIVRYFNENHIENKRVKYWDRARIADLVKNPAYVQSDLAIYEFFKGQGSILVNDAADFIGTNGCYLYSGVDTKRKSLCLKGQNVVIAPHEGIISSDVWIKCRNKCLNNQQIQKPLKASNTWLAGKIKCGHCGYALTIKKSKSKAGRYFLCSRRIQALGCEGAGTIYATEFENLIFNEMSNKLQEFKVLSKQSVNHINPKITDLKIQVKQIESEINTLVDKISTANDVLMGYINNRVNEMDRHRKSLEEEIGRLSAGNTIEMDVKSIRGYLKDWDEISFDDKRAVADSLIEVIHATDDEVKIKWRI